MRHQRGMLYSRWIATTGACDTAYTMKRSGPRPYHMVVTEEFLQEIDDWRRKEPDLPSRAEAIRRLVAFALQTLRSKPGSEAR